MVLGDLLAYFIGPLWYFTLKRSTAEKFRITRTDLIWLSPSLFHLGFLVFTLQLNANELYIRMSNPSSRWSFYVFCLTVFIVNTAFFVRSRNFLKQFDSEMFPKPLIRGQQAFLVVFVIWIVSFLMSFLVADGYYYTLSAYNYAFLTLAFLSLGLAFLAIVKPESYYFLTQRFDPSESFLLRTLAQRIQEYVQDEQPFTDAKFSLKRLSEAVESNNVMVSKAINQVMKTSFSDLINEYRVQLFLKMIGKGRHEQLTQWGVAQEAGFGNKVTFYAAFKKSTGKTPKEYLELREAD